MRLLAPWSASEPAGNEPPFVERLAGWLHWTQAIALSSALAASEAPAAPRPRAGTPARPQAEQQAYDRVQRELSQLVDDDAELAAAEAHSDASQDFAAYRRHYMDSQRTMESAITALRARLRQALAQQPGGAGRLAELDAALEQTLAARERALLGAVPLLLERRFQALRQDPTVADWRASFRAELRRLLAAELDFRLQPARGLLQALAGGAQPLTTSA